MHTMLVVILLVSLFVNGLLVALLLAQKKKTATPTASASSSPTPSTSSSSTPPSTASPAAKKPAKSVSKPTGSTAASSSKKVSTTNASSATSPSSSSSGVRREVTCTEAVAWLEAQTQLAGSVITSVPDVSEMSEAAVRPVDKWQPWFINACRLIMEKTPPDGVAIFYQTDIKPTGVWIDKGYMVAQAAQQAGMTQLWHKIVVAERVDSMRGGVATFAHLLCYSKNVRVQQRFPSADILAHRGRMTWVRAMGLQACQHACHFILQQTTTRTVVDPFCGRGSVLAVANEMGLHAVGVDLSRKRCEFARKLQVSTDPKTKSVEVVKASLQRWPRGSVAPIHDGTPAATTAATAAAAAASPSSDSKGDSESDNDDEDDSWTGPIRRTGDDDSDQKTTSTIDNESSTVSIPPAEPEKRKERAKRERKERKQMRKTKNHTNDDDGNGSGSGSGSGSGDGDTAADDELLLPQAADTSTSTDDHAHHD